MRLVIFLLALTLCGPAWADPFGLPAPLLLPVRGPATATSPPSNTLTVSCPGTGSTSSSITCTGTYTGTAPATTGWTYAWNTTCTGSGSVTSVASVSGGSITGIVVPTPSGACAGTLTVTTNLSTVATSGSVTISAPLTYPGDLVSGAKFAYSLRCYTASQASASQVINVNRLSDNTTTDIGFTAGCDLNMAAATTFAGTDATGTGNFTGGSTMVFSGGHTNDVVTGPGVPGGTYMCAGSNPNWTLCVRGAGSLPSGNVSVTLTWGLTIKSWYDLSGNGVNVSNGTVAAQAFLLPNCIGSFACPYYDGSKLYINAGFTLAQPLTISAFFDPVAASASCPLLAASNLQFCISGSANTLTAYAGSFLTTTANNGVLHAVNFVYNNTSSYMNVDNNAPSAVTLGSGGMSGTLTIAAANPTVSTIGRFPELIVYPSAVSPTNQAALAHSACQHWGTSC